MITNNNLGPLPNKQDQYGVQYVTGTLIFPTYHHVDVMTFCIYSQVYGKKKHIEKTLDITELLDHYEIEFTIFSCLLYFMRLRPENTFHCV